MMIVNQTPGVIGYGGRNCEVTGYGGGSGGGASTPNSSLREMSELSKLEQELGSLLVDFYQMNTNMENICDRAFGLSASKAESNSAPSPVPNGMIGTLSQQIRYLREIKNKQYDLISRIERIV